MKQQGQDSKIPPIAIQQPPPTWQPPNLVGNFKKSIARDKACYKPYKSLKFWDKCNRGFQAKAFTHDMVEILMSPMYHSILNAQDTLLFHEKQTFMFAVFE